MGLTVQNTMLVWVMKRGLEPFFTKITIVKYRPFTTMFSVKN